MRIWFALVLAPLLVASVCGWEQGNPLVVRLRGGAPMEGWHPRAVEELSPSAGGNVCFQACLERKECTSWTSVAAGCATWTGELDHIALTNFTGGGAHRNTRNRRGCFPPVFVVAAHRLSDAQGRGKTAQRPSTVRWFVVGQDLECRHTTRRTCLSLYKALNTLSLSDRICCRTGEKATTARRALREEPAAPALCYLQTGAVLSQQEPIPTAHVSCEWASGVRHAALKRLRPLAYKPLPLGTVRPTGIPTTTKHLART